MQTGSYYNYKVKATMHTEIKVIIFYFDLINYNFILFYQNQFIYFFIQIKNLSKLT